MARHCSICSRADRHDIDLRLARPDTNVSQVARDLGISRSSVQRHVASHLGRSPLLVDLTLQADALAMGAIHAQAQDLYVRSMALLAEVEAGEIVGHDEDGEPIRRRSVTAQVKAIREVRANLETLARLSIHGEAQVEQAQRVDLDDAIARALARAEQRRALAAGHVEDAVIVEDGTVEA